MSKTIQYAYKCNICSDFIIGQYHKMVSCSCNKVALDVGSMNIRITGDLDFIEENWTNMTLEEDSTIEEFRDNLLWGSYPLTDEGESSLDIWYDKEPQANKDYYKARKDSGVSWMFPTIEEILEKEDLKDCNDWLDLKPNKTYKTMNNMDSSHIIAIIKTQNVSGKIKDAFKQELNNRGIDTSNI